MNIFMMASSSSIGSPIGLTYHFTRLSIGLKKRGHEVTVLSGPNEEVSGLSTELMEAGIEHFIIDHIGKRSIRDIYKNKIEIERILKLRDVDVFHLNGLTHTINAYLAVKSLHSDERPPLVTNVHHIGHSTEPKWKVMAKRMVIASILNKCSDLIVPLSDNARERLMRYGLNPKKTITVHNAIDLDAFDDGARRSKIDLEGVENNKPNIVWIARLIPEKGHEYYLMAAAEVLKKHPANFYVIGSGPRMKYLKELAHRLAIENDVLFTGRIQWPEIYYILSNIADICVSSSLGESSSSPYYILECMAAGKPIVATNVGGISETVMNGVNGYLVPPRDSKSLANAILGLINDPNKAKQIGMKARRLVEQRFSMDVISQKLSSVYKLALERKRLPKISRLLRSEARLDVS